MMYCPKCGNQLPDGAAFCGSCGNKVDGSGTSALGGSASSAASVNKGASALRLALAGIAAAALAVVALALSFAPWFDISSQMRMVAGAASGLASGLGALTGGSASAVEVADSYAVWGLVGLADAFKGLAQAYSPFGGSDAAAAALLVTLFSWACLILWLAALVFTVWGTIAAFMKGRMAILRAGMILMAATVAIFYVFAGAMTGDTGSPNALPAICLALSIVALACSFMAKKVKGA